MKRFIVLGFVLTLLLVTFSVSTAQMNRYVQEFVGNLIQDDVSTYQLNNMEAGRTLYAFAETLSGDLDTVLALYRLSDNTVVAYNDDGGENTTARFSFTFDDSGDYLLVVGGYEQNNIGTFRLLVGLDDPAVMWGTAVPGNDAFIANNSGNGYDMQQITDYAEPGVVEEIHGTLASEATIHYDLPGLRRDQTLYIYVEAIGDEPLDTYILVGNRAQDEYYAFDDDSGAGKNPLLEYLIRRNDEYTIEIGGIGKIDSGDFRMLIGVNTPEVLSGAAPATGTIVINTYTETDEVVRGYDCSVLEERPELTGEARTRETENFIIHYTFDGYDGATGNFVEEVAEAVEFSWNYQVNEMGWAPPPPDCGEGGDERFDIYIVDTIRFSRTGGGFLGSASPERIVEDNPRTSVIEIDSAYSYLTIDNNFYAKGFINNPRGVMRSTVAHEINHNIQFGYDVRDAFNGLYEATAVWAETRTYPEESDFVIYTDNYFNTPDICVGGEAEGKDNNRIYGEWFLFESIASDYGDEAIINLWAHLAQDEGLNGFYRYLESLDTTAGDVIMEMATRNLLHDYSPAIAARLTGNDLVRVESNVNGTGDVVPRRTGVQELGVDYVRIGSKQLYSFALDDLLMKMRFVGIRSDGVADIVDLGRGGTVDTRIYNHAYLIILNTRQHEEASDCIFYPWQLNVAAGDETQLTPLTGTRSATGFNPAG